MALVACVAAVVPVSGAFAAARPAVSRLSPVAGPVTGGTVVVVTGSNLAGARRVLFGSVAGTRLRVLSTRQVQVTAPAHAAGVVDLRVTTAGGTSAAVAADRYTYQAAPRVTRISPANGPAAGGTVVLVTGTNLTRAGRVLFGSVAGTHLRVLSGTQVQVTAPAHAAGVVHVRVTTPGGTSAVVAADRYTFRRMPSVTVQRSCAATNGLTGLISGVPGAVAAQVSVRLSLPGRGSMQGSVAGQAPTFVYQGVPATALPATAFTSTWTLTVNGTAYASTAEVGAASARNCSQGSWQVTGATLSADRTRLYLAVAAVGMVAPTDTFHRGMATYALMATGSDGSSFTNSASEPTVWDGDELVSTTRTGGTFAGLVTLTARSTITGAGPTSIQVFGFTDDPSVSAGLPRTTAPVGGAVPAAPTLSVTGVRMSSDCATVHVAVQAAGLTRGVDYLVKRAPGYTVDVIRAGATTFTGTLDLETVTFPTGAGALSLERSAPADVTVPACTPAGSH